MSRNPAQKSAISKKSVADRRVKLRDSTSVITVRIDENLNERLSLNDLSMIAHFSPFHFQRLFKHYIGESPKQYTKRLRFESILLHFFFIVYFPRL